MFIYCTIHLSKQVSISLSISETEAYSLLYEYEGVSQTCLNSSIPNLAANRYRYHCMLTFGYEQRNTASAGMLAREHLSTPFHLAMVLDDTQKFVHTVTVYTDSNPSLASELAPILKERGARLDDRKIASLEKGTNDSEMVLRFEDGSSSTEGFLVHQPYSKVNEDLVSGLGLELDDWGDIKVAPLFCSTSVPGLYAAGDCASMMKTILNALSMGTCAGAGIARELPIRVTGHSLDWADRVMALREKEGVVKA